MTSYEKQPYNSETAVAKQGACNAMVTENYGIISLKFLMSYREQGSQIRYADLVKRKNNQARAGRSFSQPHISLICRPCTQVIKGRCPSWQHSLITVSQVAE